MRVIGGDYQALRAAIPAEEPLRRLLLQLPEAAFDDTTEGLSASEKQALALTGRGGAFRIARESGDHLLLEHHDGRVEILRLASADGSAVLAVMQTNGRNSRVQVWRKVPAASRFTLWAEALPEPSVALFYTSLDGAEAAHIKKQARRIYQVDSRGISLRLTVGPDQRQADAYFELDWDGYGFILDKRSAD
jgi:hypothetical protein